jgi:hypothetical protein
VMESIKWRQLTLEATNSTSPPFQSTLAVAKLGAERERLPVESRRTSAKHYVSGVKMRPVSSSTSFAKSRFAVLATLEPTATPFAPSLLSPQRQTNCYGGLLERGLRRCKLILTNAEPWRCGQNPTSWRVENFVLRLLPRNRTTCDGRLIRRTLLFLRSGLTLHWVEQDLTPKTALRAPYFSTTVTALSMAVGYSNLSIPPTGGRTRNIRRLGAMQQNALREGIRTLNLGRRLIWRGTFRGLMATRPKRPSSV